MKNKKYSSISFLGFINKDSRKKQSLKRRVQAFDIPWLKIKWISDILIFLISFFLFLNLKAFQTHSEITCPWSTIFTLNGYIFLIFKQWNITVAQFAALRVDDFLFCLNRKITFFAQTQRLIHSNGVGQCWSSKRCFRDKLFTFARRLSPTYFFPSHWENLHILDPVLKGWHILLETGLFFYFKSKCTTFAHGSLCCLETGIEILSQFFEFS